MQGLLACALEVVRIALGLYALTAIIVWVLMLMMVKGGATQAETNKQLARASWLAAVWPLVFFLCVKGKTPLDLIVNS